jgi:PKD repeat protein
MVLDDFNRSDGTPGEDWSSASNNYEIVAQHLVGEQAYDDYLFWAATPYGADQEAFVTLTEVNAESGHPSLALKSSSNVWLDRLLKIEYDAAQHLVWVTTYNWENGFAHYGAAIPVTFVNGDQFGARATADGVVEVYRNGSLLATRDISAWPYAGSSGYVGVSVDATEVALDDVGGGSVNTEPVANFVAAPTAGEAPLTVTFTNRSALPSAITSYLWSFGDGTTSTAAQPVHVYSTTGHFTVTLTVFGATMQDTLTRSHYIDVIQPAGFPSTTVLDDFNRSDGAPGSNWSGMTSFYHVTSQQLAGEEVYDLPLFWSAASYGVDQEAFVTLAQVDANSGDPTLLLKSTSSSWPVRVLGVTYVAAQQRAKIWTYDEQGLVQRGTDILVTFSSGDQFGARATADGVIEVYRNGTLVAVRDASAWAYVSGNGYVGLSLNATGVRLDNFGGGTVVLGP